MERPLNELVMLRQLAVGAHARIAAIQGGHTLLRRLMGLGLRVGTEVDVLLHRGHGVVVASSGNRVALGGGVAEKLLMEPLSLTSDTGKHKVPRMRSGLL